MRHGEAESFRAWQAETKRLQPIHYKSLNICRKEGQGYDLDAARVQARASMGGTSRNLVFTRGVRKLLVKVSILLAEIARARCHIAPINCSKLLVQAPYCWPQMARNRRREHNFAKVKSRVVELEQH